MNVFKSFIPIKPKNLTIKLRIRYIDRSSYPQKRIKAYQETYQKTYWSIINRFLNNKKIPIISPVFFEGKLTSDFEKKAELFNNHFASRCSFEIFGQKNLTKLWIKNRWTIKLLWNKWSDILSFIKNLNASKVHGIKYRLERSNYAVKQ